MKECFNSLDDDGSGDIGIDELKEPLIGLGFATSLDEVQKMVEEVDDDGSGCIEFPEFLNILSNSGGDPNGSAAEMTKFFKQLSQGKIGSEDMSFSMFVQKSRRRHLMNSLVGCKNSPEKKKGQTIMKNLKKQIADEKKIAFEEHYKKLTSKK